MKRALTFPKLMGIPVSIHWTFTLLIIWIVYSNVRAGLNAAQIGWMVLFVLSLFLCVTLHELGHALAARRYGIQTKDITLYPIGGVARLEKMPEKPVQELVVAFAGPAVNIVIMLLLTPFILQADLQPAGSEEVFIINQSNFLAMLGLLNVWLAVFNLIPAFPMDGGRVLRALLSIKLSRVRATEIASVIGKVLAVGFALAGFYLNPFLIFIGIFIFLGAHAENEMVKSQSFITGLTAKDAMMTNFISLDKQQPVSEAVKVLLDGEAKNFLITSDEVPYGYITREDIIRGITQFGENAPLENICNTQLQFTDYTTELNEVFLEFQKTRTPLILVQRQNKTIGLIDAENIGELILIRAARKGSSV
jgi:Zn-dependent protease